MSVPDRGRDALAEAPRRDLGRVLELYRTDVGWGDTTVPKAARDLTLVADTRVGHVLVEGWRAVGVTVEDDPCPTVTRTGRR
ncbi:MAG TPA: hypothetical protein VMK83_09695 [Gaiellaceae bacterium]|nr:hypothetical protein [Gaiellaceae bacterium]